MSTASANSEMRKWQLPQPLHPGKHELPNLFSRPLLVRRVRRGCCLFLYRNRSRRTQLAPSTSLSTLAAELPFTTTTQAARGVVIRSRGACTIRVPGNRGLDTVATPLSFSSCELCSECRAHRIGLCIMSQKTGDACVVRPLRPLLITSAYRWVHTDSKQNMTAIKRVITRHRYERISSEPELCGSLRPAPLRCPVWKVAGSTNAKSGVVIKHDSSVGHSIVQSKPRLCVVACCRRMPLPQVLAEAIMANVIVPSAGQGSGQSEMKLAQFSHAPGRPTTEVPASSSHSQAVAAKLSFQLPVEWYQHGLTRMATARDGSNRRSRHPTP